MIAPGIMLLVGTVLTHAQVVTEAQPATASVLAYRDGRIVYVGDDERAALRAAGADARVESLAGKTIVPGFDDAHVHFGMAATIGGPHGIDVEVTDRRAWLAAVTAQAPKTASATSNEWLFVTSRNLPEGLSAKDLDRFARPVFAVSSHGGLVNARGCAAAQLSPSLAPNGFVRGGLMALALARTVMHLPRGELVAAAHQLLAELAQNGITSAQLISDDVAPLFEELRQAGQLTARLRVVPLGHLLDREAAEPSAPSPAPLPAPEWVRRYGVKYFHDDGAELSRAELARVLDDESARGEPLVFHVLSSHALGSLLDALERQHKKTTHPAQVRVEHLDDVTPSEAQRLARLGIWVCTNPSMIPEWRRNDAFPLHTLVAAGVHLCFGSDFIGHHQPERSLSPLEAIRLAITHAGLGDRERIDGVTALRAITLGSASAEGRDDIGQLAVGKRADFVVLSGDPRTLPAEKFGALRVLSTVVDGREVFHAAP